jgi:hypothetical protein
MMNQATVSQTLNTRSRSTIGHLIKLLIPKYLKTKTNMSLEPEKRGLFGLGKWGTKRNEERTQEAQERHDEAFNEAADTTGFPDPDENDDNN